MTFLAGSICSRRFQLTDTVPRELDQVATLAMRRYSFRPIDTSRGEREAFGWVNPRQPLDEVFTWEQVLLSPVAYLGARNDRKNLCAVLQKARVRRRVKEEKQKRSLEKISRQQRLALEEEVTLEMLAETSPQSAFYELAWDLNTNLVYMGATSEALCNRLQELFEATFDLKLKPLFPSLTGADFIARQGLEDEFRANTDLMGQMKDYATLGPDFLTWLLVNVVEDTLPEFKVDPSLTIDIEGPLLFATSNNNRMAIAGSDSATSPEVSTALRKGKVLHKARLIFRCMEDEYAFNIDASTFDLRSVKLPVPNLANEAQQFDMRMEALGRLYMLLDELFELFLQRRLSPQIWAEETNRIRTLELVN